jgi:hypothetical protein
MDDIARREIVDHEMQLEAYGDQIVAGLLRDEMRFSTLFERFVRKEDLHPRSSVQAERTLERVEPDHVA